MLMRRVFLYFLVGSFVCMSLPSATAARSIPGSFADLIEKLSPAVVNVSTTQKVKGGGQMLLPFEGVPPGQMDQFKDFFEQFGLPKGGGLPEQEVQSLGSGFVIDPQGYIVTNNHVIESADEITVRFQDDTQYKATLVGRDTKTDLALLKIDAKKRLPYVGFGDSDKVRVGDWVIAIGNPYGLGGSVTTGIISARSRHINAGPFDDFLQTDAAINRGNSGGPMFDTEGNVIGVNTAIFSPTGGNVGIGFAIPATLVQPVIQQLKEHGRTHRGWLGVKIQHVTEEVADSLGLKKPHGALVLEVTPDSPAAKAGIEPGDVILRFDGKEIKEMRELPRIVAETKIGSRASVTVWRGETTREFSITTGELDEEEEQASAPKKPKGETPRGEALLGMTLATINADIRKQYDLPKDTQGVLVLEPGTMAGGRGIAKGDAITGVGQRDVADIAALKTAIASARKAGKKFALLRVLRGTSANFVTLPTEEEPEEGSGQSGDED